MIVQLEIDTDKPLAPRDQAVLLALAMVSLDRGEAPQARGYIDQDDERPISPAADTATGGVQNVGAEPDTSGSATAASEATPKAKRSRKAPTTPTPDGATGTVADAAPPADPFAIKPANPALTGDVFSNQIREANAETRVEAATEAQKDEARAASVADANGAPAFTVKDVNDAAAAAMERCRAKGVSGAKEIKSSLAEFKTVAGAGVDRLADLQPSDWGVAIGKMNAIAA